jgi:hypothetical protein
VVGVARGSALEQATCLTVTATLPQVNCPDDGSEKGSNPMGEQFALFSLSGPGPMKKGALALIKSLKTGDLLCSMLPWLPIALLAPVAGWQSSGGGAGRLARYSSTHERWTIWACHIT